MSRFQRVPLYTLLGFALSLAPQALADANHGAPASSGAFDYEHVKGAAQLEGRIIAPCCWNQTIDIHGSEVSTQLRREIRERLKTGETPEAIEASFVERYGQKIVAVKPGSRLGSTAVLLAMGMGAAGVFAFGLMRRWRDRSGPSKSDPKAEPSASNEAALDARVDAELAALDRD
jgi:cytochrome c-type biogenesis protein CcmH